MPVHAGHPCAGRGLHPRPERSTHARAEEQRTESRNQKHSFHSALFPDLESQANIYREVELSSRSMPVHAGHAGRVLSRPCAGRGLNPRPERSTPARTREQSPENKNAPDGGSRPLSRSGVEPPTGTIHPRRDAGTEPRKQKKRARRRLTAQREPSLRPTRNPSPAPSHPHHTAPRK